MSTDHPCRPLMDQASNIVKKQSQYVNTKMAEASNVKKVFEVYTLLEGSCEDLVVPGRIFVEEEEVEVSESGSKKKELILFLFSDILLLVKKPTEGIMGV